MLLIAFRHGLRASELVGLRWEAIDFNQATLHVRRAKNGKPGAHPLTGREMRALRRLQREHSPPSAFVFMSERDRHSARPGFTSWSRAGVMASLGIKVHPHMLRHATGFDLANRGTDARTLQDYLGHRNIQHTVRYTELTPHRFKDLWSD
jgi:integrase